MKETTMRKQLFQIIKKMKQDVIALKEKRMLFFDKSKMLLDEIGTSNENKLDILNTKYETVEINLKQNFEETENLNSLKEAKIQDDKKEIEQLSTKQQKLEQEIFILKESLAKKEKELETVNHKKKDIQNQIAVKKEEFQTKELELKQEMNQFAEYKEELENLKVQEEQTKIKISNENTKLKTGLAKIDEVITRNESKIQLNTDHFEHIFQIISSENPSQNTANIYIQKREFENKKQSFNIKLITLQNDKNFKENEILEAEALIQDLIKRISSLDANKKNFIKDKKFSEANQCMKQSKALLQQKSAELERIEALKNDLVRIGLEIEDIDSQIEAINENAADILINVKQHNLESVKNAISIMGVFDEIYQSCIFDSVNTNYLSSLKILKEQLNEKQTSLIEEIKSQNVENFEGNGFLDIINSLKTINEKQTEINQLQSQIEEMLVNEEENEIEALISQLETLQSDVSNMSKQISQSFNYHCKCFLKLLNSLSIDKHLFEKFVYPLPNCSSDEFIQKFSDHFIMNVTVGIEVLEGVNQEQVELSNMQLILNNLKQAHLYFQKEEEPPSDDLI